MPPKEDEPTTEVVQPTKRTKLSNADLIPDAGKVYLGTSLFDPDGNDYGSSLLDDDIPLFTTSLIRQGSSFHWTCKSCSTCRVMY